MANDVLFDPQLFKNDEDSNNIYHPKKLLLAQKLNIRLEKPQQEKRIKALFKLTKHYLHQSDAKSYLCQQLIANAQCLTAIYLTESSQIENIEKTDALNSCKIENLEAVKLNHLTEISALEDNILLYKKLFFAHKDEKEALQTLNTEQFKKLKEIDDICFENWLKLLDINYELRNTIIGYHNRMAMFKAANAYVNYHLFVDKKIEDTFEQVKKLKKDGIKKYYEVLRDYELPSEKQVNFQLFLQKRIESMLHDAIELKAPLGAQLEFDKAQLTNNIELIQKEHKAQKDELVAIINYYKESLLKKQVIFTEDADGLVTFLKDRYVEKINEIYSKVDEHQDINKENNDVLTTEDKDVLLHLAQKNFDTSLDEIKQKYAEKLIPVIDSFDKIFVTTEAKYAFDRQESESKLANLKKLKNSTLKLFIDKFNTSKQSITDLFNTHSLLIKDANKLTILEADKLVQSLKEECEIICLDLLSFNQKFWTKLNAEFNSEVRRYLVKLRREYVPWVYSWSEGSNPWFHDYLIMNLHQEYLSAIGHSLKGFSPEAELFIESSKALLQLNEYLREVYKNRDEVEHEHLLKLNTIPTINSEKLEAACDEKLLALKQAHDNCLQKYNACYNRLIKS